MNHDVIRFDNWRDYPAWYVLACRDEDRMKLAARLKFAVASNRPIFVRVIETVGEEI